MHKSWIYGDQMVNYIWLSWKLACILRTYRTCNSTVRFLKYEFNNKLLSSVTLLRVIPSVTLNNVTPLNNLLLNSYFENLTTELHELGLGYIWCNSKQCYTTQ